MRCLMDLARAWSANACPESFKKKQKYGKNSKNAPKLFTFYVKD